MDEFDNYLEDNFFEKADEECDRIKNDFEIKDII